MVIASLVHSNERVTRSRRICSTIASQVPSESSLSTPFLSRGEGSCAAQQAAEAAGRGLQPNVRLQPDTSHGRLTRGRSLAAIRWTAAEAQCTTYCS